MSVLQSIRNSFGMSPAKADRSPEKAVSASIGTVTSPKKHDESLRENPVYGYLVLESSRGVETQRFPIRKRITTVGRLQSCDIRIYEETISRLHCQICVDEAGKLALQIFNPRGVRLNEQKIQKIASASSTPNIYPLQTSDLIEMFAHRFRLEAPDSNDDHRGGREKIGRKSLRMSLVSTANSQKSTFARYEGEGIANVYPTNEEDIFSDDHDKENVPMKKGGNSKKNKTSLPRTTPSSAPWGDESDNRKVNRCSQSPNKVTAEKEADQNHSIAVMEEVDDADEEVFQRPVEAKATVDDSSNQSAVQKADPCDPPSSLSIAAERLTKSCSPKKKKRRSSFFGRAGIFAGINFGFYPEERRDGQDEAMVEGDMLTAAMPSSPSSPGRLQRDMTPEPPLDVHGRPRLPRSLSSPSGFSSGSPGKRRVISLRTATLIRSGQIAFEQKKLLSPPPSPTKGTFSSMSLPPLVPSTPPEKAPTPSTESAVKVLASPEKEAEDAFDEEEVDKSLSSLMDEDANEEREKEEEEVVVEPVTQPDFSAAHSARRARKSHGGLRTHSTGEPKGRTRISLPGKIAALPVSRKNSTSAVDEWRKEWQEQKEHVVQEMRQDDYVSDTSQHQSQDIVPAHAKAQDEDVLHEGSNDDSTAVSPEESVVAAHLPAPSSSYSMLRHMVRDSPALNALLDQVTEAPEGARIEAQTSQDLLLLEPSLLELTEAELDVPGEGAQNSPIETVLEGPRLAKEPANYQTQSAARAHFVTKRPSRRVSESARGRKRRRSSASVLAAGRKPRKSAAAFLPSARVIEHKVQGVVELENPISEEVASPELVVETPLVGIKDHDVPRVLSRSPKKNERKTKAVSCSPRKRNAETTVDGEDTSHMTRPGRAAKVAAAAAIVGEGASLRERQESTSPQKSLAKHMQSTARGGSSDQPGMDDLLVLSPSSPIKRLKRAARNNAEEKIRAVLAKKPSIAALRDARTLSETGAGLAKANPQAASSPSVAPSKAKASQTTRTRIPAKVVDKSVSQARSEPSTRTTRSRAARKEA